jgi:hypothetical protein
MHHFDDLGAVQSSLQHLMKREPPLVKALPRQAGTKEVRYVHLFSGEVDRWESNSAGDLEAAEKSADAGRITKLEEEVSELRRELTELKQQYALFKKQFE